MAKNVNFTRDEVILALDVLYNSNAEHLGAKSKEIIELSQLLNDLPIHPREVRPANFRNCSGVSQQISFLRRGKETGIKNPHVGIIFFDIDCEFEGRTDELHRIAEAIRRNREAYSSIPYGAIEENDGFPEGILLRHLHKIIEYRDGKRVADVERCQICRIQAKGIYAHNDLILEKHLLIPPDELDAKKTYLADDFIVVCPNCHSVLHRNRPWRNKYNCEEILR